MWSLFRWRDKHNNAKVQLPVTKQTEQRIEERGKEAEVDAEEKWEWKKEKEYDKKEKLAEEQEQVHGGKNIVSHQSCPLSIVPSTKAEMARVISANGTSSHRNDYILSADYGADIQTYLVARAVNLNPKWSQSVWAVERHRLEGIKKIIEIVDAYNTAREHQKSRTTGKKKPELLPSFPVLDVFVRSLYILDVFMMRYYPRVKLELAVFHAAIQLAAKTECCWSTRDMFNVTDNMDRVPINKVEKMILREFEFDMTRPTVWQIVESVYAKIVNSSERMVLSSVLTMYSLLDSSLAAHPHTLLASAICRILILTTTNLKWDESMYGFFCVEASACDAVCLELTRYFHDLNGTKRHIKEILSIWGIMSVFEKWSKSEKGKAALQLAVHGHETYCEVCE